MVKNSNEKVKSKNSGSKQINSPALLNPREKRYCVVLVADLLNDRFEPLSQYIPPCLLPLNNIPILHITLSTLIADGFKYILIYAHKSYQKIKEFLNNSHYKDQITDLKIDVRNLEVCNNLGDIMRDLDTSGNLSGVTDFLLAPADLICSISLSKMLLKHKERRNKLPNAILSLLLPPASQALGWVEAAEFKVHTTFSRSEDNRLISYIPVFQYENCEILLSTFVNPELSIESSFNLMDIQLAICSNHIPALFQDNFDYRTMEDLVNDVLSNEEIMGYTIHVEPLPSGPFVFPAAPDLNSLIELNPLLLSRRGGYHFNLPLLMHKSDGEFSMVAYGSQTFVALTAKVHPKARLIGACLIGPGCEIGESACLIDCVLGVNCFVGEHARLRRVIAMDNVHIGDHVRADVAWLCSKARILSGFSLPFRCFIGPPTTAAVTLGPGKGNLPPKCVIVAPQQGDIIIEPSIGGEQAWATIYCKRQHTSGFGSTEDLSEDSASDNYNQEETERICRLWETVWERLKVRAKSRRQIRSTSRTGESCSSKTGKLRRLTNETNESEDVDSQIHFNCRGNMDTDDDEEKSEEFLIGELKVTLERSLQKSTPVETVVLEINSLRLAYNIQIEDLCFMLCKSLIQLACSQLSFSKNKSIDNDQTKLTELGNTFHNCIKKFSQVLNSCGYSNAGSIYLEALEDTACYDPIILAGINWLFYSLYVEHLVTKDEITSWCTNSRLLLDDELNDKTELIRQKLKSFFNWLDQPSTAENHDNMSFLQV